MIHFNKLIKYCSTLYLILFFLIISYQVFALLSGFELDAVSYGLRLIFIIAIILIALELRSIGLLGRYTSISLLQYSSLLLSLIFYLLYYQFFLEDMFDNKGRSSVQFITSYTTGIISWIIQGSAFYLALSNSSGSKYIQITSKNSFLASALLLILFLYFAKGLNPLPYQSMNRGSEFYISHLSFGAVIIYIIYFIQSLAKKQLAFWVFVFSLLTLAIIDGRSDLIVYIITAFIYFFLFDKDRIGQIYILFTLPLAIILGSLIYLVNNTSISVLSSYTSIFIDKSDLSQQARSEIFSSNINNLPHMIFTGNPNYYIEQHNSLGAYTHNILSVWEYYGLFMFMLIIFIIVKLSNFLILNKGIITQNTRGKFLVLMFTFTTISIIASKAAHYYPFWFTIGYFFFYIIFEIRASRVITPKNNNT